MRILFNRMRWVVNQVSQRGSSEEGNAGNREQPVQPVGQSDPEPQEAEKSSRRAFLAKMAVGFTGLAAIVAGVPVIGVLFSPVVRRDEEAWHNVGAVEDFPVGDTVEVRFTDRDPLPWAGPAAENAAWLRRTDEESFVAFSIYCTHTGCPVAWTVGANLFLCPCHGGIFDREGAVVGGPPQAPLDRLAVRVQDGQVEISTAPVPVTGETT